MALQDEIAKRLRGARSHLEQDGFLGVLQILSPDRTAAEISRIMMTEKNAFRLMNLKVQRDGILGVPQN